MKTILLMFMILTVLFSSFVYGDRVNPYTVEEDFEGSIIASLLNDLLSSLISGDYNYSEKILFYLENITIPESLGYRYRKLLESVDKLIDSLRETQLFVEEVRKSNVTACSMVSFYEDKARAILIKLYSSKSVLINENLLDDIMSFSLKRVNDSSQRFLLGKRYRVLYDSFRNIFTIIERDLGKSLDRLKKCEYNYTLSTVSIYLKPDEAFLGDTINVFGWIKGNFSEVNFKIIIDISGIYRREYYFSSSDNFYNFSVKLPSYEDLMELIEFRKGRVILADVKVYAVSENFEAYNKSMIKLRFVEPKIVISCPVSTYYGRNISFKVNRLGEYNGSILVYIDGKLLGNYSLGNSSLKIDCPGCGSTYYINIDSRKVGVGFHTVYFSVLGYGRYIKTWYSCALAVVKKVPSASLSIGYVTVYPLNKIVVSGNVLSRDNTSLNVYVDGRNVYSSLGKNISVSVDPPFTFVMGIHKVSVNVTDIVSGGSYVISQDVLVINPLGFLFIVGVIFLALSLNLRYDIVKLPIISEKRPIIQASNVRKSVVSRTVRVLSSFKLRFRETKIIKFYYSILTFLFGDTKPKPSETLREFLIRVKKFIDRNSYVLLAKITLLAEKDLYSANGVNEEENVEFTKLYEELKHVKKD